MVKIHKMHVLLAMLVALVSSNQLCVQRLSSFRMSLNARPTSSNVIHIVQVGKHIYLFDYRTAFTRFFFVWRTFVIVVVVVEHSSFFGFTESTDPWIEENGQNVYVTFYPKSKLLSRPPEWYSYIHMYLFIYQHTCQHVCLNFSSNVCAWSLERSTRWSGMLFAQRRHDDRRNWNCVFKYIWKISTYVQSPFTTCTQRTPWLVKIIGS